MVGCYDGCIRQADAALGRLCDGLERRGVLDETLLVVTADHGEAVAESTPLRDSPAVGHGSTAGVVERQRADPVDATVERLAHLGYR